MSVSSILICLFCMIAFGKSIPPSQCFEPFNFEDCGRNPLHVLYFYKPGARCEVAIWRGCPTRNMFKDEYECINTCIFVERAKPEDYHNFAMEDDYQIPMNYGEVNDTVDNQEGTTVGDEITGPDGEGTTESGGSDKEAGTDTGEPGSDGAGTPAAGAQGANDDAGSAKEGATEATTGAAADAAPDAPPPEA